MRLFDIDDISRASQNSKYFTSVKINIYEKKYVRKFQRLVSSQLRYIDGILIENLSSILNRTEFKKKGKREALFDSYQYSWWQKYWKEMPFFEQYESSPLLVIKVNFKTEESVQIFSDKIERDITDKTKSIEIPKSVLGHLKNKLCIADQDILPKYPIYVISKGRWESRLTSKILEEMRVPYRIVIEPQEYKRYSAVINSDKILVLPFSNLGQGSIPARNWVWEHSISEGHDWHWILDDNIRDFYRLHQCILWRVKCPNLFRAIEQFVERFENIGQAGMHYKMFTPRKQKHPPFILNSRVYSCILIRNDLLFRWRGKYNEDTDLSLRVLKSGLCTVLLHAFNCDKIFTLTMKGGNTEEIYGDTNERLEFAESLKEQHPDHVKVVRRFNRWHHYVDYSVFRQKLKFKKNIKLKNRTNEFKMKLIIKDENKQRTITTSSGNSKASPSQ